MVNPSEAAARAYRAGRLSEALIVLDREGVEIEASDVLLSALRAAERLIRALPSYDDWSAWTVSVHDEQGSLVKTVPFPANTDHCYALRFEDGIDAAFGTPCWQLADKLNVRPNNIQR